MKLFWELIFLILLVVAIFSISSGCAMFSGQKTNTEISNPPTPGTQLWNAAKKSNWLVTLSILGVAGGLFALANGSSKLGISTMAASTASLFMALAVARYASWMAVFGLIGSVAAALFSILARRKALVEIIRGVQKAKDLNQFDGNLSPVLLLKIELSKQSNTTKKIVGNIKNQMKLKGEI